MPIRQNGETLGLIDGARARDNQASDVETWEVEGASGARLIVRDSSQTAPAGIFAFSSIDDYSIVERAIASTTDINGRVTVTQWEEISRFTGEGAEFTWDEDVIEDLIDNLILMVASGHPLSIKVRQLFDLVAIS